MSRQFCSIKYEILENISFSEERVGGRHSFPCTLLCSDMTMKCHHVGSLSEKIIDIENEGVEKNRVLDDIVEALN